MKWIHGFWLGLILSGCQAQTGPVVTIYCAHDRAHAEQVLELFEKETGIRVEAVYDTEASKTVGLAERLRAERERPRCDVHWSNEPLRSVRLANEGLYRTLPENFAPGIDAMWRDPQNRWCGFAGRVRALALAPDSPAGKNPPNSVRDLTAEMWRGKVALADPRLGTTGSHMAILKWLWGEEDFQRWLDGLHANEVRVVASNSASRDRVISGEVWIGLTDTDDIEVVRRRGVDLGEGFTEEDGVILLPNVVGLIEGSPQPQTGETLARWLLSPRVEEMLAASSSRQVPLGSGTRVGEGGLDLPSLGKLLPIDWSAAAQTLPGAIKDVERALLDR
jgi:iron(III) transport system substrate-binding protein